ncbi:TATA element modulatory factor [Ciona intestinalis]
MSWFGFSDIAKTALNEAQKRIDKVLDIQEDGRAKLTTGSDSTVLPDLGTIIKTDTSSEQELNTSLSDMQSLKTPLKPLNVKQARSLQLSQKKRAKPVKLGVSLTKKTSPREKTKTPSIQSVQVNANWEEKFDEISLEDNKEDDFIPQINVPLELSELSDPKVQPDQENSKLSQSLVYNDTNNDIRTNNIHIDTETDSVKENENFSTESNNSNGSPRIHAPVIQCSTEATHSPCGSPTTATSSEIDILDHESYHSESSSPVMKPVEDENNIQTEDLSFPTSPDHSEASDIIRLNGHCSSPLSNEDSEPVMLLVAETLQKSMSEMSLECDSQVEVHQFCEDFSQSTLEDSQSPPEDQMQNSNTSTLQSETQNTNLSSSVSSEDNMMTHTIADALKEDPESKDAASENEDLHEQESKTESETENFRIFHENTEAEIPLLVENVETHSLVENGLELCEKDKVHSTEAEGKRETEILVSSETVAVAEQTPIVSHNTIGNKVNIDLPKEEIIKMMNEKFEVYEQQLMTLSLGNAKLNEDNDNLRSEASHLQTFNHTEYQKEKQNLLNTIDSLSEQLQDMEVEKSNLLEKLEITKNNLSQRLSNEHVQQLLAEKEDSIQGLLQEGEALSKKHLQQSNVIKKLRAKGAEREDTVKDLTERLTRAEDENKILKQKVSAIEGQSSEDRGTAERLSEAYQEREQEVNELRNLLEDAEEKRRAAQATLDAAYRDLGDMNKKEASMKSNHEHDLQVREDSVRMVMQQEMEKMQQEHEHHRQMLLLQMTELRGTVERTEMICSRREDQLKKEIQDLQQQLQDSELRNHELGESISASTRPLLRQMENLQATQAAQEKTWETLEKSLTSRLNEQQNQLLAAQDKERFAQMALMEAKSRLLRSDQQLTETTQTIEQITSELESLRKNRLVHDKEVTRLKKIIEENEEQHSEAMSKARRDRVNLENQLDMEKVRSEVEKKKFQSQVETVQKEKERLLWLSRSESVGSSASIFNTDVESVASSSDTFNHVDSFDRPYQLGSTAVYDTIRGASGSALLENLQSQLKQRDGEIAQLQGEINTLERTRSSMAEEIVRLTNENEEMEVTVGQVDELRGKLKEVTARHDAVLTMYGEKAEQAEELKLDLEDVKTMYRNQIDSLLRNDYVK